MRLALCAETLAGEDFAAQCAFAAALGYEGLEIAAFRPGSPAQDVPRATRAEWRRIAAGEGIAITGFNYAVVQPPGLSITSADPAVRARTLEAMRGLSGLCADLGGSYVVHGSPDQRRLDPADRAGGLARAAEAYAQAGAAAAAAGVTYLVEPVRASRSDCIHTVADAAAIVRAAGTPGLRTMLDTCTAAEAEAEPPEALLERWLPTGLIAHVHVNDANRRAPGEGTTRFAPVVAALRRHGYAGWVAVEPFVFEPDRRACAARAAGYMRGLMEAV
ncbi:MAG: TIM barrel protein [Roseomonas sp.]|nr:TIM barrel protein [Roseomonas sp.]